MNWSTEPVVALSCYIVLGIAIAIFVRRLRFFLSQGFSCLNAFTLVWFFAYAFPLAVWLLFPNFPVYDQGLRRLEPADWLFSVAVAVLGYLVFALGYRQGSHYRGGRSRAIASQGSIPDINNSLIYSIALALFLVSLTVLLWVNWRYSIVGVRLNYIYRGGNWLGWVTLCFCCTSAYPQWLSLSYSSNTNLHYFM